LQGIPKGAVFQKSPLWPYYLEVLPFYKNIYEEGVEIYGRREAA
jgi:hypothetical protein